MEQAVIVYFPTGQAVFASDVERALIHELADNLNEVINEQQAGEYDGEEFGQGRCVLFMYGPNADHLFEVIAPVLRAAPITRGGYVIKRYGDPQDAAAREVRVNL